MVFIGNLGYGFPNLVFVVCVMAGAGWAAPALAMDSTERLARLEARIVELEKRLAGAERRALPSRKTSHRQPAVAMGSSPSQVAPGAPSTVPAPVPAAETEAKQTRDLTPSEFSVFRDNAATLASQKFEAAVGFSYTKRSALFQSDRSGGAFAELRYGIFDGVELSLNAPIFYNKRVTQIGPDNLAGIVNGVGDVSAKLSANIFKETADLPGVVATVGLVAPTGASPLKFSSTYQAGDVPFDILKNYGSRGAWGTSGNLQIYKTLDPIIIFAGIGFDHTFDTNFQGYHVNWGERFNYNAGFAFAVNEKTTIGFQVNGAVQNQMHVNGVKSPATKSEPITARVVVVQRIFKDTYLEPSVGFALSNDAPDVTLGVTLRRRF